MSTLKQDLRQLIDQFPYDEVEVHKEYEGLRTRRATEFLITDYFKHLETSYPVTKYPTSKRGSIYENNPNKLDDSHPAPYPMHDKKYLHGIDIEEINENIEEGKESSSSSSSRSSSSENEKNKIKKNKGDENPALDRDKKIIGRNFDDVKPMPYPMREKKSKADGGIKRDSSSSSLSDNEVSDDWRKSDKISEENLAIKENKKKSGKFDDVKPMPYPMQYRKNKGEGMGDESSSSDNEKSQESSGGLKDSKKNQLHKKKSGNIENSKQALGLLATEKGEENSNNDKSSSGGSSDSETNEKKNKKAHKFKDVKPLPYPMLPKHSGGGSEIRNNSSSDIEESLQNEKLEIKVKKTKKGKKDEKGENIVHANIEGLSQGIHKNELLFSKSDKSQEKDSEKNFGLTDKALIKERIESKSSKSSSSSEKSSKIHKIILPQETDLKKTPEDTKNPSLYLKKDLTSPKPIDSPPEPQIKEIKPKSSSSSSSSSRSNSSSSKSPKKSSPSPTHPDHSLKQIEEKSDSTKTHPPHQNPNDLTQDPQISHKTESSQPISSKSSSSPPKTHSPNPVEETHESANKESSHSNPTLAPSSESKKQDPHYAPPSFAISNESSKTKSDEQQGCCSKCQLL